MEKISYYKPTSLKEAYDILKEQGKEAIILNGGTFVISQIKMKNKFKSPKALVDIKGIKELKNITFSKEEGLHIGATLTLGELIHNEYVINNYPILVDAAKSVGCVQTRNRVTLVGNNCTVSPFADTTTPLIVLDAIFEVYSDGKYIDIPVSEFYKDFRKNVLNHSDIVTKIKIPYYEDTKGVFSKIGRRKEFDIATMSSTVAMINNEVKIALQTVDKTPIRAWNTEKYLKENKINIDTIKEASELAKKECNPVDDLRGSKEYRLKMVGVTVKRSLIDIFNLEEDINV